MQYTTVLVPVRYGTVGVHRTVWYGTSPVRYRTVRYLAVWYRPIPLRYGTVPVRYGTVPVQVPVVLYGTVPYDRDAAQVYP